MTEDEILFGEDVLIYCDQHLAIHRTGWCTVDNESKIKLESTNVKDAIVECRNKKYVLYEDIKISN